MAYLTEAEIPAYCSTVRGVTIGMVEDATTLINAYVGGEIGVRQVSETIKLNRKKRGKLKYSPIVSVDIVKAVVFGPFGGSTEDISNTSILLDAQMDGYFTFDTSTIGFMVYGVAPSQLQVTYTVGYDPIPEDVKRVCGWLAQNLKQKGGFMGEKALSNLDFNITFMDDSLFTSDIRRVLSKYKGRI